MEDILIEKATRQAIPMMFGFCGQSGGGKTFSALLFAAGLVGEGGKVCVLDTDNRRASAYATDPKIKEALPQGYSIVNMTEPYTPARFLEYAKKIEQAGFDCLVIDTITHEYEGTGGLEDMAAASKTKWMQPKIQHKKMMNGFAALNMDVIFTVRARERVKVIKDSDGKDKYVDLGVQPICEKNFMFEMLASIMLDPNTNHPKIMKRPPTELRAFFNDNMGVVTKAHGARFREWKHGGVPLDPELEKLKEACREAARQGNKSLDEYIKTVPVSKKALLAPYGAEFRGIAESADSMQQIILNEEKEAKADFEEGKFA